MAKAKTPQEAKPEAEERPKLTPKQEAFCHAYIENGGNASAAYREAYDAEDMQMNSVHVASSRLLSDSKVALRVKELRDEIANRHKLSVADLLNELEQARVIASTAETPQASAMVAASLGKAKLLGYDKQKIEINGNINAKPVSDDDLDKRIRALASQAGIALADAGEGAQG